MFTKETKAKSLTNLASNGLITELLQGMRPSFYMEPKKNMHSQTLKNSKTYTNTESLSTTRAGDVKGNPYILWTRYLYNKSQFLSSLTDV